MATIREIETIKIPILLTKDDEDGNGAFMLTCRPLSIYIQAKSEEQATKDFRTAFDLLLKHLIKSKKVIRFFKQRNIIDSDKIFIAKNIESVEELKKVEEKVSKYQLKAMSNLRLGSFANAEIELTT